MSGLGIETGSGDPGGYVRFTGKLDISAEDEAERTIADVERSLTGDLVFDLRSLEFMDSTGLRIILSADARARERGGRAVIVKGPESVHRIFRMASLEERLRFVDDPSEVGMK